MNTDPSNIKEIFSAALNRATREERSAFLDEACQGNAALRNEVEELLAADAEAGSFLGEPAVARPTNAEDDEQGPTVNYCPSENSPGDTIGRYKLLQQIGEGGFGVVFMAEQTEPVRRKVALKIIKPGMDTKDVIARFEAERQALALMDHTNIARVFDAGRTDTGRPYFVMELVNGIPINDFCDRHRLDTKARLKLFVPVCSAVQHAHQKGVIHRDLKPSNILITLYDGTPVPKVIDFGIAKAISQKLTEKTLFTAYGQFIGTPQYMSPEQSELSGLDIDTRADVYALGATLYEVLSGCPPFDPEKLRSAGFREVLRIIQEEDPLLPSQRLSTLGDQAAMIAKYRHAEPASLGRVLRGDLDWIVMRCLQKDRSRRYATPNDLSADIQRYLNVVPIQARPISPWGRRWRWCRRNPAIAILTASLLLVFATGFVAVAWQWRRAENSAIRESLERQGAELARKRADVEADRAELRAKEARHAALLADMAADEASANLYATRMNLAQRAWDDGQLGEVVDLLSSTTPGEGEKDRRSLEWNYLSRLCDSHLSSFSVGAFSASEIAYSPDGTLLAAALYQQVKIWSIPDRRLVHSFPMRGTAQCVVFSPDGSQLVSADGVGNLGYVSTIKSWDVESGAEKTITECAGGLSQLIFSPDGERLIAAIGFSPITVMASQEEVLLSGAIKVWRVSDGSELYSIGFTLPDVEDFRNIYAAATEAPAVRIASNPSGDRLAGVTAFGKVKVWNAENGYELLEMDGGGTSIAFSKDGQKIISGATTWNASDGSVLSRRRGAVPWLVCDGVRALSSTGGVVSVFDVESNSKIATLRGQGVNASRFAISPDGWRIASAENRQIKTWDAQGGQEAQTLTVPAEQNTPFYQGNFVEEAAISPDGLRVATAIDGSKPFFQAGIAIWDRITGKVLIEISEEASQCMSMSFSPDGTQLAVAFYGEDTVIWDSRTGEELHRFTDVGQFAAFSPDGSALATIGDKDKRERAVVFDTSTGEATVQFDLDWYSMSELAFHPSGRTVAIAGRQAWEKPGERAEPDVLAVCNVEDGSVVISTNGPAKKIRSLAYSPSGERLAVASYGNVHILDAYTLQVDSTLRVGASHVTFSPDGKRLLTGSNNMVRIYDVQSHQEVLRLKGAYTGVSFDDDGNYLVAGGRHAGENAAFGNVATAKIWDFSPIEANEQTERVALGLVRFLAAQSLNERDVEQRILENPTINAAERRQTLNLWAEYLLRKKGIPNLKDR